MHAETTSLKFDWHGEWKTWKELHDHPGVKELRKKADELVSRAASGMKGTMGTAKGGAKGKGKAKGAPGLPGE